MSEQKNDPTVLEIVMFVIDIGGALAALLSAVAVLMDDQGRHGGALLLASIFIALNARARLIAARASTSMAPSPVRPRVGMLRPSI